ncbi:hypothetical protein AOQ84DRAFT_384981 [Glonium stellatum]|uniref:Exonuclease 1 n=1 Tax=Glonium stellatum TaxID=574774 RepID=A0A8E2FC15_9PEZI|nr:hypothetical protein AOQ84DRAFT_384981 [Glonium stellatum]
MGISGLLPLLKSIQKPCNLKAFAGRTIGVDAYGWLHRGTVSCAIDLALDKPTTKYVDFAMSRVRMLVHFGITPFLVFDGDYLPSKAGTEKERAGRRKESKKLGLELLKLGKTSQAHLELQKAVDVTPEMARLLIEELKRHKIQYVVAPYEADSQLAYLERKGIIHGILSEDSDLLVFGAKCLITKLDQYGDCVMINRGDFTACREISLVGWTDADFRRMAILSGCDYLASINKMGLKTAYRLLRKHKTVERLLRAIQFDSQFKVPPGYLDAFIQAEMTFLYQWVFCPIANQVVNCTDVEPGVDLQQMDYIGHHIPADIALGVSSGDLNPHTKEPIVVETKNKTPSRPLALSSNRQNLIQTPDLKKTKSIDTFFRPKRTPLAELDPNSFTPSPSQQRLLNESPRPWSAVPAPPQTHSGIQPTSFPSSAPQPSRRAISDSWTRTASAQHPSKRQRLCSDTTASTPYEGSSRVESGRSRFFTSNSVEESPSLRTANVNKQSPKKEFNLWSDDSIEEAMAELPNLEKSSPKARKIPVFTDDSQPISEVETSQVTTSSRSTLDLSQETSGTLTPATSFNSLSASEEPESTLFSAHLSAEMEELRTKFSYQPRSKASMASTSKQLGAAISSSKRPTRTLSAPISKVTPKPPTSDRPISEGNSQDYDRSNRQMKAAKAKIQAGSKHESVAQHINKAALTTKSPEAGLVREAPSNKQSLQLEFQDSGWVTMKSEIVIPRSESGNIEDFKAPEPVLATEVKHLKGSEDLLIPDSEGGESDGSEKGIKVLDLGRFAFSQM